MFRNVLDTVQQNSAKLSFVYLQTGTKYYGMHLGPGAAITSPWTEEAPRLKESMFYYELEDYLKKAAENKSWTWSVARPPCIIGYTARTIMNFGVSLAVYAAVMKEMGKPLIYPYSEKSYRALREFVDTGVLCRFILWLTPDEIRDGHPHHRPYSANQAFNITNGDYVRCEQLWPQLARYFGMDWELAEKPFDLVEFMKGKEEVWQKVVEKYQLAKNPMSELCTFDFLEMVLKREFDELSLNTKSLSLGWHEQMNTEKMFFAFFDGLKNKKIIPQ